MGEISKLSRELRLWISNHRTEATVLFLILLLASFLRLWKIDQYLPFLGDEGRDVRIVARFITHFDLMFIGPRTSIGDMYLGPLYYYFITPWLLLFRLSPVGPAVSVAVLDIITVWFVWYVGREWFGKAAGITAALLYALSPVLIESSKHSWNPNIMPFFALLSIYSVWRVWAKKQFWWLAVLGVSFAFVLQSHYLGLLLLPTLAWMWISALIRNWKLEIGNLLRYTLASLVIFAVLMSPLVLFDYKHGWHNFGSMFLFFIHRQETVSARPWSALPLIWPLWRQIITSLVGAGQKQLGAMVAIIVGVSGVALWTARRARPLALLLVWIGIGLLGLGSLKQNVYDHYFGFLWPAPFLLVGALVQIGWGKSVLWKFFTTALVGLLVVFNLINNPLRYPPQNQLKRTQDIDKKILEESGGKPFNIGLVAERNYDEGYLYFFEMWNSPVREADPQHKEETVTDQLFVICEKQDCSPTTDASSQIAHFGPTKVVDQWIVKGVKLYKLEHTKI